MGVNHIFRAHSRAPPAQWVKIHSEKTFKFCLFACWLVCNVHASIPCESANIINKRHGS